LALNNTFASEPLYVTNTSPLAGLLGLPAQRTAASETPGSFTVAMHAGVASHYVSKQTPTEELHIDGETASVVLDARYGFAPRWDVQLELPWIQHSRGQLDSVIDSWHDLWGTSTGGRSSSPPDQLRYYYRAPDNAFDLPDKVSGVGDITLALNRELMRTEKSLLSARLGYKFASGRESNFLGSGGDDVFISLNVSGVDLGGWPLGWHGQIGYLRAGSSDLLGSQQEKNLWFAGVSFDWAVRDSLSLLAQLDSHAAPLDSDITALGSEAFLLSLGMRWRFTQQWSMDFSLIEDVRVSTAPDVTFQASLRYRP